MMLTGRIGGKVIVNEDINKFFDQIKDLDWTDNNIYKPAKITQVKPTFSTNQTNQGHFQSKLGFFDQYLIEDNSNHLNDFKTYKNDVESKYIRVNDRITTQKNDFLQLINVDGINDASKKSEILEGIKNNLSQIVNNSKLKEKIGNLVNAMENQNQNSMNSYGNNNNQQQNNYMNNNQNQGYNFNQMGMNQGFNNNMNMNMNNTNRNQNNNWGNYNVQPNNNFNFK